jgi:glycosyltransferase involved in cell wall biosynthesis
MATSSRAAARVVVVTEAAEAFPSGYIRAVIYRPLFRQAGIDARFISRRPVSIVRASESLQRTGAVFASRALSRAAHEAANWRDGQIVRAAKDADAVYLQKTTSLRLIERLRQETSARIVYDLNDGVWLPHRAAFAGGKVTSILAAAHAITCDNEFGLQFAAAYNRDRYLVPDPPQVEDFDAVRRSRHGSGARTGRTTVRIGWVGSPASAFNLFAVWRPLERLFRNHDQLELRLVGVGRNPRDQPRWERVRTSVVPSYSRAQLIEEVLGMDIGIYPLFDVEDSLARGILKATVYMSGGACLVAAANDSTRQLVEDGTNGLLASDDAEWERQLSRVVTDMALRERLAGAGLETIRARFALDTCFRQLLTALLP